MNCAAATRNFLALENHSLDVPFWQDLVTGLEKPIVNKGYIKVPETPGLGIELNDDECKKHLKPGTEYFAPTPMTDRTWHLFWIAVSKHTQAKGVGGKLLRHVEDAIRGEGGRMLLIETSTLPHYDLTRKFYLKHGYELDATVHDFYAEGDHMAVFRKRF